MNKKDDSLVIASVYSSTCTNNVYGKNVTVIIIIIFAYFEKKKEKISHFEMLVVKSNFNS